MPQSSDQSANDRERFPAHFTFSQRYGYEPLPEPMQLEHISYSLRVQLCDALEEYHKQFEPLEFVRELHKMIHMAFHNISENDLEIMRKRHKRYHREMMRKIGKFDTFVDDQDPDHIYNTILMKGNFNEVIDFLEIIINKSSEHRNNDFIDKLSNLFVKYSSSYCLDTSQRPYWFFPRTSKEEGEAVQQAIKVIRQGEMDGGATHLRKAAKFINTGDHSDSIRESIHAVESIARTIDPTSSKALVPALKSLEDAGLLKHKALKEAFIKLYGYASDEQGIRHSLLEKSSADVGPDEAIFMFGACASFAAYLSKKHQTPGRA